MKLYPKVFAFALCASIANVAIAEEVTQEKKEKKEKTLEEFKIALQKHAQALETARDSTEELIRYEETEGRWKSDLAMRQEFDRVQKASDAAHQVLIDAENAKNEQAIEDHEAALQNLKTDKETACKAADKKCSDTLKELQTRRTTNNAAIDEIDPTLSDYNDQVKKYHEDNATTITEGAAATQARDDKKAELEKKLKEDKKEERKKEAARLEEHEKALEDLKQLKAAKDKLAKDCATIFIETKLTLREECRRVGLDYQHIVYRQRQQHRQARLDAFNAENPVSIEGPSQIIQYSKHYPGYFSRSVIQQDFNININGALSHFKGVFSFDEQGKLILNEEALQLMSEEEKQLLFYSLYEYRMSAFLDIEARKHDDQPAEVEVDDKQATAQEETADVIEKFGPFFHMCLVNKKTGDAACKLSYSDIEEAVQRHAARKKAAAKKAAIEKAAAEAQARQEAQQAAMEKAAAEAQARQEAQQAAMEKAAAEAQTPETEVPAEGQKKSSWF